MAASDVLVSPAYIWYAPVGEALPSPDTIAAGVAWGGSARDWVGGQMGSGYGARLLLRWLEAE
jgi:hypothetical protein